LRPKQDLSKKRIVVDKNIGTGKPVIKGTRILVDEIVRRIVEGRSFDEILQDYPNITKDDIKAVLEYAARSRKSGRSML
jgi:uncharacterized protein (DUF433 family)